MFVYNKEKLFHTTVEMITHSVTMFWNCSVVHDLSTSKDYSTILYTFVSMGCGKKLNESEKKQFSIL